jgi:hypothetical protein
LEKRAHLMNDKSSLFDILRKFFYFPSKTKGTVSPLIFGEKLAPEIRIPTTGLQVDWVSKVFSLDAITRFMYEYFKSHWIPKESYLSDTKAHYDFFVVKSIQIIHNEMIKKYDIVNPIAIFEMIALIYQLYFVWTGPYDHDSKSVFETDVRYLFDGIRYPEFNKTLEYILIRDEHRPRIHAIRDEHRPRIHALIGVKTLPGSDPVPPIDEEESDDRITLPSDDIIRKRKAEAETEANKSRKFIQEEEPKPRPTPLVPVNNTDRFNTSGFDQDYTEFDIEQLDRSKKSLAEARIVEQKIITDNKIKIEQLEIKHKQELDNIIKEKAVLEEILKKEQIERENENGERYKLTNENELLHQQIFDRDKSSSDIQQKYQDLIATQGISQQVTHTLENVIHREKSLTDDIQTLLKERIVYQELLTTEKEKVIARTAGIIDQKQHQIEQQKLIQSLTIAMTNLELDAAIQKRADIENSVKLDTVVQNSQLLKIEIVKEIKNEIGALKNETKKMETIEELTKRVELSEQTSSVLESSFALLIKHLSGLNLTTPVGKTEEFKNETKELTRKHQEALDKQKDIIRMLKNANKL